MRPNLLRGMGVLCLVMATTSSQQVSGRSAAPNAVYRVGEIQAKLYYSNRGMFSANVIDNPRIVLWNVPIGEGTVGGPSDNTFLQVTVTGRAGVEPDSLTLHVVAYTREDTLVDEETDVGPMNARGNWYGGYWLYDTGCDTVVVAARLSGLGANSALKKIIPFDCGD